MPKLLKACFFDANGVLYHRTDRTRHRRAFLARHGIAGVLESTRDATGGVYLGAYFAVYRRAFIGQASEVELFDALLAAHGVTDARLLEEGRQAMADDQADITLYPGVIVTLGALRARGVRLGVITDSASSSADKLRWFRGQGLTLGWDAFANSCEVGARKPDARIYRAALTQADVVAGESVFVGHKASELVGARALGMATVAFRPDADAEAPMTLFDFVDLLALPFLA
ncbi:MAG: hypothetical protein OJF49_002178 [Ktedonobacterales bacterium]|jgi:FMN phosphatase YigB (HAD superfamily)|nr:MAG: hypothetical protein OJF49_002178 [Ktedonobacterales bacterium]